MDHPHNAAAALRLLNCVHHDAAAAAAARVHADGRRSLRHWLPGRRDGHARGGTTRTAREGKRWHRNDFAAPAVPLPTERAPPPATIERRAEVPAPPERRAVPPERRAAEPSQRSAADSTQQKTQLSAAEEELIQGLPTAAERAEARKIFEERLQGPLAFGNALESSVEDDDEADSIPDFYGAPAILGLERCATFFGRRRRTFGGRRRRACSTPVPTY